MLEIFLVGKRRPVGGMTIRMVDPQQLDGSRVSFGKQARVGKDLLRQFRTVQRHDDLRIHAVRPPTRAAPLPIRRHPGRTIRTGSSVWRTTVSVTLPNTQRFTPERPWEHIAMKLSGVLRPSEMISSAPKPSFVVQVTLATPNFFSSALFFSRYSRASLPTSAINSSTLTA